MLNILNNSYTKSHQVNVKLELSSWIFGLERLLYPD